MRLSGSYDGTDLRVVLLNPEFQQRKVGVRFRCFVHNPPPPTYKECDVCGTWREVSVEEMPRTELVINRRELPTELAARRPMDVEVTVRDFQSMEVLAQLVVTVE